MEVATTKRLLLRPLQADDLGNAARQIEPALHRRYLVMVLDGMRAARPCSRLPVDSLTVDETHTAITGG